MVAWAPSVFRFVNADYCDCSHRHIDLYGCEVAVMTKKARIILTILIAAVVVLLGIQLIPVKHDNPPVQQEPPWDSQQTRAYAKRACFDCHSNETDWPWYAYVAPISWFTAGHVHEGREHLNFSEWPLGEEHDPAEEVEEGKMPLRSYTWLHPEARLTKAEKQEFIDGLRVTFGGGEQYEHDEDEH